MGYEPTNWKDGDLVTSAKLNKLEQGIANNSIPTPTVTDAGKVLGVNDTGNYALTSGGTGGGGNVLVVTENDGVLDKTWQEIVDALHTNGVVLEMENESGYMNVYILTEYGIDAESGNHILTFFNNSGATRVHWYSAENADDYPINDD